MDDRTSSAFADASTFFVDTVSLVFYSTEPKIDKGGYLAK